MNSFNVEFWTSLIVNFLIGTLIFIVTYSFFYIQNKNQKFSNFLKSNKINYYIWLVFISVVLTFIPMLSLIDFFRDTNIFLISNIFLFAIFFNSFIGYLSLSLNIVVNIALYFTKFITLFTLLNSVLLIALCLFAIFLSWIFIYKNSFLIFIYSLIIALLMNFDLLFVIDDISNTAFSLITTNVALFMYLLLNYAITKPFTRFIINAKNINDRTFMENNFILNKYFFPSFKNYQKKNNLQFGVLFIVKFNFLNEIANNHGASLANKIRLKILDQIREIFSKENSMYFITKNNDYAFIVKENISANFNLSVLGNELINRDTNDPLKKYELMFKRLPNKLLVDQKEFNINLKVNSAVYGIQENDIEKLIDESSTIIKSSKDKNIILVYDKKKILFQKNEEYKKQILKKSQPFETNELDIKYFDLDINKHKYKLYKPVIINKLYFNWNDVINKNNDNSLNDAIISHISARALNNVNNNDNVLIYYDQHSLSNMSFDVNNFIDKIKQKYNLNNFSLNLINIDNSISDILIDNIREMLKHKIKIYINEVNENLVPYFKINENKFNAKELNTFNMYDNFLPRYELINR